jgi:hypothetical protein
LDHVLEQTETLRLTNATKRAEPLDRITVMGAFENVFIAIRNIVEGGTLSEQEKKDVLNNIAACPVILDNVAQQQVVES